MIEDDPFEAYQARCNDPATLAEMAKGWRDGMGINIHFAAKLVGLPARTLEGVEQGRGFRYPVMLMNSMINAKKSRRNVRGKE